MRKNTITGEQVLDLMMQDDNLRHEVVSVIIQEILYDMANNNEPRPKSNTILGEWLDSLTTQPSYGN